MALSKPLPYLFNITFFLLLVTNAKSVFFNFTSFRPNMPDIDFQGDASPSSGDLKLTKSQHGEKLDSSVGRASYAEAVRLWDASTGRLTDFTTHFTFVIKPNDENKNPNWLGDGMAFFIIPLTQMFDTFANEWDPRSNIHMGININSIISVTNVTLSNSIKTDQKQMLCSTLDYLEEDWWKEENEAYDASMDDEFQKGTGPKRFTYRELRRATNNFAEIGKLGEGGFGGVYRGLLAEDNTEVAVKRGEFLLVYEFMPNGSLDSHLFRGKTILTWTLRYKVAVGLASALLYLHDEWEQCVVHRDIKSSNIMLDSNFNAKLGDFGIARLVDHELGSQTTVLAGTMGYLAPECVTSGKASKESDVYSFGVVALEISCGRRPVEQKEEPSQVRLVEWVWDLYGKGQILEAVDEGLRMEFDERQVECLMVVGLWCCHPDPEIRPSIKQVINVLNFEVPLPSLPAKLPVPMYLAPPLQMCSFSYTSSDPTQAGSVIDRIHCSCSSCNTYSSTSAASSEVLLNSHEAGM
ncbi:hypothetical protein FNV43_RR17442 [Rhamnella rubrinervis]|uniref:Protein kinase domain-containing protein n=1 Tax=Rhamnella rubrinervis TaxID=2594499 RepID=A0A8K0GRX2_9ROSA|nr:hypothetical protein FNV43_RR17442 [Rhamnella rubrinervis]